MDPLSHGLWGAVAFGRKNRRSFWTAFGFGFAPDLFSFGLFFVSTYLGLASRPPLFTNVNDDSWVPDYIHSLYGPTHSLVIFLAAFFLVWIIRRKPLWEMAAWGLHVIFDIFGHTRQFFPTPFLWPISEYRFDGWHWSNPWIYIPNVALLVVLSLWFFVIPRRAIQRHAIQNKPH
mgnify:CR=1 FL=1